MFGISLFFGILEGFHRGPIHNGCEVKTFILEVGALQGKVTVKGEAGKGEVR